MNMLPHLPVHFLRVSSFTTLAQFNPNIPTISPMTAKLDETVVNILHACKSAKVVHKSVDKLITCYEAYD